VVSERACGVCGGSLADKYANALTCKSACRQKAYRQRLKAKAAAVEPTAPELTPQGRSELWNLVARERLRRAGGFTKVEREERRIERRRRRQVAA
jgi:hypothetical protein